MENMKSRILECCTVKSILCQVILHVQCSTQLLLPSSPLFVITVDRPIWSRSFRFDSWRLAGCLTPFSICIARVTKWPRTLMSLTLISLNFQRETSETLRITNKGNCVSSHDDELVFRALAARIQAACFARYWHAQSTNLSRISSRNPKKLSLDATYSHSSITTHRNRNYTQLIYNLTALHTLFISSFTPQKYTQITIWKLCNQQKIYQNVCHNNMINPR